MDFKGSGDSFVKRRFELSIWQDQKENVMPFLNPWDNMINDNVAKKMRLEPLRKWEGEGEEPDRFAFLRLCWLVLYVHGKDKIDSLSPTLGEEIDCVHTAIVVPPHSL